MSEQVTLVCALADAPLVVRGSTFSHRCSKCARAVMVAPSGQRLLRNRPGTKVVCDKCMLATMAADQKLAIAGSVEEVLDEARNAEPNHRRQRN
jgi:hypothetical protein